MCLSLFRFVSFQMKQHIDFITQLPESIALRILSFLSPKELVEVSRVGHSTLLLHASQHSHCIGHIALPT